MAWGHGGHCPVMVPADAAKGVKKVMVVLTRAVLAALTLLLLPTGTRASVTMLQTVEPVASTPDECSSGPVRITRDFEGAAFARCQRLSERHFVLTIEPEDEQVRNCSPWYGFGIQADRRMRVRVDLRYTRCGHRYIPKISADGEAWRTLSDGEVNLSGEEGAQSAQLRFPVGPQPQIVAAQELVTTAFYDRWMTAVAALSDVQRARLGASHEGRPIDRIVIAAAGTQPREHVLLLGRQHPPETTGAIALFAFVERLMGDDPLARQYRARFATTVIPLLNPDGVARGHWRHNLGATDLNRDWGPFAQPETRLVRDHLAALIDGTDNRLRLMIDFHSTQHDVVYTLPRDTVTEPADFTARWLARYAALLPGYSVDEQANHNVGSPVAKAWFHDRYRVPTATYEIGDTSDREGIRRAASAAATAMMEQLLASPAV